VVNPSDLQVAASLAYIVPIEWESLEAIGGAMAWLLGDFSPPPRGKSVPSEAPAPAPLLITTTLE
jgi:hypothetical protein